MPIPGHPKGWRGFSELEADGDKGQNSKSSVFHQPARLAPPRIAPISEPFFPVAIWLKPNSCSRMCKTVPGAWGALVRGPPSPSPGLPLAVQVLGKRAPGGTLCSAKDLQAVRSFPVF